MSKGDVVVVAWTGPGYTMLTDLELGGTTDATDRSHLIAAWTGAENCAP